MEILQYVIAERHHTIPLLGDISNISPQGDTAQSNHRDKITGRNYNIHLKGEIKISNYRDI